jgi:DNA-binding NarL/FixJ family response regulator
LDVTDIAPSVTVPTLILHARKDAVIPFKHARNLAALIPDAQFVSLESKNHILLEDETAWPRFLAEVRRFLGVKVEHVSLPNVGDLTERECELLELIAQGLSNDQIAQQLVISPKTVRNHITSIFSKIQVTSRAQAIVQARQAGFGHRLGLSLLAPPCRC